MNTEKTVTDRSHDMEMEKMWEAIEFLFPWAEKGMSIDRKILDDAFVCVKYSHIKSMLRYRAQEKRMNSVASDHAKNLNNWMGKK